jgi:hypothetical protein
MQLRLQREGGTVGVSHSSMSVAFTILKISIILTIQILLFSHIGLLI